LEARQAALAAEKAGGNLWALGGGVWMLAKTGWGWATVEVPAAYNASNDAWQKARKCYENNGGKEAHTYDEYKAIAAKCWNN